MNVRDRETRYLTLIHERGCGWSWSNYVTKGGSARQQGPGCEAFLEDLL
jgi:hypothetical protein